MESINTIFNRKKNEVFDYIMNKKNMPKYYFMELENDFGASETTYHELSDERYSQLKELMDGNKDDLPLFELLELSGNADLYANVITDYADKTGYLPVSINLDAHYHLFEFTVSVMDDKGSMPVNHKIMLEVSDADYADLVTACLMHEHFAFNKLALHSPMAYAHITEKICRQVECTCFDKAFAVFADEAMEDAKIIVDATN